MNKKIFMLAMGLAVAPLSAQVSLELPSEYINNSTTGGVNTLPPDLEGSPYLKDTFYRGMVHIEDKEPYAAMLRYNAYQDEMQIQDGSGLTSIFMRDYIWVELGGETFKTADYQTKSGVTKGYFVELNQGSTRLLKRYEKVFREAEAASSSYSQDKPPRFEDKTTYYLIQGEGPAREIKLRKKDVLEVLSSKEAASFVKEKKLKLKSEEEVLQLVKMLNAV